MKKVLIGFVCLWLCAISTVLSAQQCWQMVSAGIDHTVAIKADGTLWAWGFNGNGQLGDGTTVQKDFPTQIGTDNNWKTISAGGNHTLAIKTDGTLWVWGDNSQGQLGTANYIAKYVPTKVGISTNWESVYAGRTFSFAIKTDGTLLAWGDNFYGQLGFTGFNLIPSQVGTDADWDLISPGGNHTLAIKKDGTLWAWGSNLDGQLGDGTNGNRSTPTRIGNDTNWKSVVAGYDFSVALKTNGTLWAWGNNDMGQLGDGTYTEKTAPIQIGSASDWQFITAGLDNSLALKTDGTLWKWGWIIGRFGFGSENTNATPTLVETSLDWQSITSGDRHSFAFESEGELWGFGDGTWGKLGIDTWVDQGEPVIISTAMPEGNPIQAICNGGTVADLHAIGTNVQWYASPSGGAPLTNAIVLEDGKHYYASQTKYGCESVSRLEVTVLINTTPTLAPTGNPTQILCSGSTLSDVVVSGSGIKWYTASSGGVLMEGNTTLTHGIHYYASQTVNGCESSVRFDVAIVLNETAAPTGSSNQTFCIGATVADLAVTGTDIKWYDSSSGGSTLPSTTPLVDGTHYYASQIIGSLESCTRLEVRVAVSTPEIPEGAPEQIFCDAGTVADLTPEGNAIIWYNVATGGTPISKSTPLVNGAHYYARYLIGCEPVSRLEVKVTLHSSTTPPPNGTVYQTVCPGSTLTDLVVEGTEIKWYSEFSGGAPLEMDTPIIHGEYYYASQSINSLESCIRMTVVALIDPGYPPVGEVIQTFCNTATIGDLVASGIDIIWYDVATGGSPLATSTNLINGQHYFASEGMMDCPGTRLEVEVIINSTLTPPPTGPSSQMVCSGATVMDLSVIGDGIKWYNAASGGSPLSASTLLVDGQHYFASQTQSSCESASRLDVQAVFHMIDAPTGNTTQTFCAGATVANLVASGVGIKWYATSMDGPALSPGTMLVNGAHYYATQTVDACQSVDRLEVVVDVAPPTPVPIAIEPDGWQTISSFQYANHNFGIKSDGTLRSWGPNLHGQLGTGTSGNTYYSSVLVDLETDWKAIDTGLKHTVAIKSDGTLWAWGDNEYGQLGDGTMISKNAPAQIGTASNWSAISVGRYHSIALKTDGTLWAWGNNEHGQLGDGTNENRLTPVQIDSATNWASVSVGLSTSFAIKSNGTLWGWGYNGSYLGDGTTDNRNSPLQIGSASDWKEISIGSETRVGIKNNGTLWAWGGYLVKANGQEGVFKVVLNPMQLGADTDWKIISSSSEHGMGIKTNGTLWAIWGRNVYGKLALPEFSTKFIDGPMQIGTGVNWRSVETGLDHTFAIKNDGTLWGWGRNDLGQLPGIVTPFGATNTPQQIYTPTTNISCSVTTIGDLIAEGTSIQWYAEPEGGLALSPSTAIVNGSHYYATQTIGFCESASRMELIAINASVPPAPIGTLTQVFCEGAMITDLEAIGRGIKWYSTAMGGSLLPTSNMLVNGEHYFATQTISSCESVSRLEVHAVVHTTDAPTGSVSQTFCTEATVADLVASGVEIKWYIASTGGSPLSSNTLLINGTHYYASQTVNSCESVSRLDVVANVLVTPPPTGIIFQTYCSGATIGNLIINGMGIKWYATSSGGAPLSWGDLLVNNNQYFATQTISGCESVNRFSVQVSVQPIPDAPTGESPQEYVDGMIFRDLVVNGNDIKWYESAADATTHINHLSDSLLVVDGLTYYATQTISNCESKTSLPITVLSVVTGVEFDNNPLNLYPNPVDRILNISAEQMMRGISVTNVIGKNVLYIELNSNYAILDFSSFETGIYFIQVHISDKIVMHKVIKL